MLGNWFRKYIKKLILLYLQVLAGKKHFCIISNDCWGGELYKILNRPFNTPFIGLMVMSPCYLKLLSDLPYFLKQPLFFINHSKYKLVEELRCQKNFPIAVLGNSGIEICFLHYDSNEVAEEKWIRRIQRIDWDNLFIKYDCGKDYSSAEDIRDFLALPLKNKLLIGKEGLWKKEIIVINPYSDDALQQFKNCFLSFNPVSWLNGKLTFSSRLEKNICQLANKYL